MATQPKLVTVYGLLCKKEATYNAGDVPSATTDAVQLDELPKMALDYANDGGRPAPPAILGYQRRVVPSGRAVTLPIKVTGKGSGAAYSASVFVPQLQNLLQLCGMDAAVTTTGGSEKWAFTPTAGTATYVSGSLYAYARAQLFKLTGALGDFTVSADGPVCPTWDFNIRALMAADVTDVSLPAITYQALTIDPPKATNILFTLGNFTGGVVRKFTLKWGRTVSPRLDINAGGHAGFAPARRTPTLEVTYETPALTTTPFTTSVLIDPYELYEAGTNAACSLQIGSVQFNRIKFATGGAQIMTAPVDDEDGPVALTTLSLQLNPSTLNANDDLTITAD